MAFSSILSPPILSHPTGKVNARSVAGRVPARGSVAGLAMKIPLRFALRDFGRVSRSYAVPTPVSATGELALCKPTPCPLP